jgi:hypothetical protein
MVKEKFGDRVYDTTIPRNVRTSEAPSYGQPVIHYDPTCKGAVAYRAFAKEFIARTPTRFTETPSVTQEVSKVKSQENEISEVKLSSEAEISSSVIEPEIPTQEPVTSHDQVS